MKKQQNEELAYLLEGNTEGLQKILPEVQNALNLIFFYHFNIRFRLSGNV